MFIKQEEKKYPFNVYLKKHGKFLLLLLLQNWFNILILGGIIKLKKNRSKWTKMFKKNKLSLNNKRCYLIVIAEFFPIDTVVVDEEEDDDDVVPFCLTIFIDLIWSSFEMVDCWWFFICNCCCFTFSNNFEAVFINDSLRLTFIMSSSLTGSIFDKYFSTLLDSRK